MEKTGRSGWASQTHRQFLHLTQYRMERDTSVRIEQAGVSLICLSGARTAHHSGQFRMFGDNVKYLAVGETETFMDERPMCAVRQV